MQLKAGNTIVDFEIIPLSFLKKNIENVFFQKNNKSLLETFAHKRYKQLSVLHSERYQSYHTNQLGVFLQALKASGDDTYKNFLNKHGDGTFCEFEITSNLSDKGIYSYIVNGEIKYIGRCTDSFKKRINSGYGKIHPKNCFIDGQSTNCHINSLVNTAQNVQFGIHIMTDKSTEEIKALERLILTNGFYEWNKMLQKESLVQTTELIRNNPIVEL